MRHKADSPKRYEADPRQSNIAALNITEPARGSAGARARRVRNRVAG